MFDTAVTLTVIETVGALMPHSGQKEQVHGLVPSVLSGALVLQLSLCCVLPRMLTLCSMRQGTLFLCLYRYPTDLPSIECVSLTHVIAKLMSPGTLSLIQSKSGFMWEKLLFCLSSYAGIVCELHNMAKTFSKVGRHF